MAEVQALHEAQVRGVLEKYAVLRKVVSQYNGRLYEAAAAGMPQGSAAAAAAAAVATPGRPVYA
jgi:hypothetical protein